jgi:hypothetical protein
MKLINPFQGIMQWKVVVAQTKAGQYYFNQSVKAFGSAFSLGFWSNHAIPSSLRTETEFGFSATSRR